MRFKPKLLILITLMGLILVLPQLNLSKANGEVSYDFLLKTYEENNTTLQEIQLSLNDALRSYEKSQEDVKVASSSWSELVNMFNRMGKEVTNEMKFSTVMQRSVALTKAEVLYKQQQQSAETQKNYLTLELRSNYLAYWQARSNASSLETTAKISKDQFSKNELLYKQHKISEQNYHNSKLSYIKSQNDYLNAQRKLTQSEQKLASFIGANFGKVYEINRWESEAKLQYTHVEPYVKQALVNRLDIIMLQDQIANNQLTLDTYDKYLNYNSLSDSQKKSYDKLVTDNYYLKYELQKKKTEVEKQIRNAYLDLKYKQYKIQILINERNDLNKTYSKLQQQYKQGAVIENEVLKAKQNYDTAHIKYLQAVYDFNTDASKFSFITNTGLNIKVGQANLNIQQGGSRK